MPISSELARNEIQTASSRVRTRVADSYNNNLYTYRVRKLFGVPHGWRSMGGWEDSVSKNYVYLSGSPFNKPDIVIKIVSRTT